MCMTMMILRDLPTLVLAPSAEFKTKDGNKIMALLVLRTRELLKFI